MTVLKTILAALISAGAMATSSWAQACTPGENLLGKNTYEVLRKGKPIGEHVISFYGTPEAMKVRARTDMKVEVLFITAFKYAYDSAEIYCNGVLESVDTQVNNNGEEFTVRTYRLGADYISETKDDGDIVLSAPIHTSNHWDASVTGATGILNTATGKMDAVSFAPSTSNDMIYEVRGDIDYDTQYSPSGQWQGMIFEHPKGGTIEFRCIDCNNTPEMALTPLNAAASLAGQTSAP